MCGTDAEDRWLNPCLNDTFSSFDFCNESLTVSERVDDMLKRIPDDEKLGVAGTSTPLSNYATELPSVGVRYSQWWSEALHGVAISPGVAFTTSSPADGSPGTPYATSFPQIIATSHSFNRTLFRAIGNAISTEIRAFANAGHAGLTYWTPNLNIFRDPRWGRGQETPGEDPFLTAAYVESYVPGLQYGDDMSDSDRKLKVSACCKHFVAYSLERYGDTDRHHFNANVTAQDMADTYLPAFESCIAQDRGAASCIMCSYNEVNGVPSCANRELLTTLARDTWGFEGYIASDCGAVEDVYDTHHYASTPEQAVAETLDAGMDLECGSFFDKHLEHTVKSEHVAMSQVDRALANLMSVHVRLGRFDRSGTVYDSLTFDANVNSAAHQQLAMDAARQAVVLLKNDPLLAAADSAPATLPFAWAADSPAVQISVVGPNADAGKTMQGNYEGIAPFLISPLAAIRAEATAAEATVTVDYTQGCEIDGDNSSGFGAAVTSAQNSDVVVLVMGLDQTQEREGVDRTSIALPTVQADLIEAVLQVAEGKPVVLVVESGGSVCLAKYRDDPRVSSILAVGYPGQAGGQGVSDALFGHFSPSGRLTQTFYSAAYADEVSFYDYNMRPVPPSEEEVGNPGRGYRFYRGDNVVYPFGAGLSFSSFVYDWHDQCRSARLELGGGVGSVSAALHVRVTNVGLGERQVFRGAAADTVLLFLEPPANAQTIDAPLKVLRGFEKVLVDPQSDEEVTFHLTDEDFSLTDVHGVTSVVPGEWTVCIGTLTKTLVIIQ